MKISHFMHFIFAFFFIIILSSNSVNAQVTFSGSELLGCPTNNSIRVNVVPDADIEYFYEYGTAEGGPYTAQTSYVTATGGSPHEVVITGLNTNTRYYYRMRYHVPGDGLPVEDWVTRNEYTFHTQRAPGSTFIFTIISDTHAEYTDAEYQQAIQNVQNDNPDLHLDLGDTQMTDYDGNQSQVNDAYLQSRTNSTMGSFGHSVPIFLASGNHENEEGWNIDEGGLFSPAVASIQARKAFFPTPNPNDDPFYSSNTDTLADIDAGTYGDQYREDYYAWTWGDALFVVFDPFQYTMFNPYGSSAGEGAVGEDDPATGDRWNWTLGEKQYLWLKQTLQNSNAKYKFMFAHHMLGGEQNYVREGATPAHMFEWGGYNADGTTWGWTTKRSGWEDDPIRQLMIDYGVSAFFHGHDHQYAYQVRDGIVYQCLPKPSPGLDFNFYSESDPYTKRVIGNSGHLRITVTPDQATVEYVRSNITEVSHSYTIQPNTPSANYDLTMAVDPAGSGTTDPAIGVHTYAEDALVTITAIPTPGYVFDHWEGDVADPDAISTTVTMNGDKTITANFTETVPGAIIYLGDIGSATSKTEEGSLVITTDQSVSAGDDIIIAFSTYGNPNYTISVADDAGNTYEEAAQAICYEHGRTYIFVAYDVNDLPSGSDITITHTVVAGATAAVASVFHGLADVDPLDQSLGNPVPGSQETRSGTTPSVGPTGTTSQANELLIGAIGTEGPVEDAPGIWQSSFFVGPRAGTTGGDDDSNWTVSMGFWIVSATGNYTAAKSGITDRFWAATIATFKAGPLRYSAISSDYNGADGFSASIGHTNGDHFTATATSGTINSLHVYRIDEDANNGTTTTPSGWFVDPLRYWGVRIFGTSSVYQVVYMYAGHPGISNASSLRLSARTGPSDDTWEVVPVEPDLGDNTITLIGQTGTEYALASLTGDNSLPVNLTSFSAERVKGGVELKWIIESQLNNFGFEIWRAEDSTANFSIIASYTNNPNLAGDGNSTRRREYSFLDQIVESGKTYTYKLSDVDYNGRRIFHDVIEVKVEIEYPKEYALYPNYPNPFNPETTIRFNIPESKAGNKIIIQIYNINGQLIRTLFNGKISGGEHEIIWDSRGDNGTKLPSGIYFLELSTTDFRQVQKMIILK